jgi:hypothetical protein
MKDKQRHQNVYGLWLTEDSGAGRWLEWNDIRIGSEAWEPHLGKNHNHSIYIFSSHRFELVKVLKYMRGEGLPQHVQDVCTETALAHYIYPDNTRSVTIRRCVLPAPQE